MWVLVFPSIPKGEIVGKYLTDNECLSLMASTTMKIDTAEKIRIILEEIVQRIVGKNSNGKDHHDQQCSDNEGGATIIIIGSTI
jgi:hypothetical protein